jgi:Fanconi anemia group M protein
MALSWDELLPYSKLVNTGSMEPRAYQINIIKSIQSGKNTLVVLPTGLGKTLIAVFAIAKALHSGKKAIMLAPTKPLGEQHYQSLTALLNIEKSLILLLTGSLSGGKRQELENEAKVISATPQTVANDLKKGRLSLDDVAVVIFDECHRAVGRYAYTYIADECKLKGVQLIGLTASPGSDRKKIEALVTTLGINNIEIRISTDLDVEPYVMQKNITTMYVDKNEPVNAITAMLKTVIDEHLDNLYTHGLSPFRRSDNMPKGRLLDIGDAISKITAKNYKFMAMYDYVFVLDLMHAHDLASSEGLYPFLSYIDSLEKREEKSRVVRSILSNTVVINAKTVAKEALEHGVEHPKMSLVVKLLNEELKGQSVIVFAQYRSTIKKLTELIRASGVSASAFVGKKDGVTQGQQQETIIAFRNGKFKVLVATSIGEEGLDIPSVDAVVFYEPIPNEIRNIQRRGRAGRMKFGQVVILVTRNTKDETYLMISRFREKRMRDLVLKIRDRIAAGFAYGERAAPQQRLLK